MLRVVGVDLVTDVFLVFVTLLDIRVEVVFGRFIVLVFLFTVVVDLRGVLTEF